MPGGRKSPGTTIESGEITDLTIVNADVAADAAIAYSKLNLSDSIVAGDLTSNSVLASEIGSLPGARVHNSGTQNILTSTTTTILFNTERFDTDSMHVTSGGTEGRLTINTAGVYMITAAVAFSGNATGVRNLEVVLNGATTIALSSIPNNGINTTYLNLSAIYKLAATDYLTVTMWQNSGSTLTSNVAANYIPEFAATWVGEG